MDFVSFIGHKRTSEKLLNNIKRISKTPNVLYENLNFLNVFESYVPVKTKIALEESKNSIKMKITSKGNKDVAVAFPNIFGNGEYLKINASNLSNVNVRLGTPLIFNSKLYKGQIAVESSEKSINDKEIQTKKAEIGLKTGNTTMKIGTEQVVALRTVFGQFLSNFLGARFDAKFGYTKTEKTIPFLKLIVGKKIKLEGSRFFVESDLKGGKIFGHTNLLEKFFLGDNLRGYKNNSVSPVNKNLKIGGNSFIEIKNKIGVFVKNTEIFSFADFGVNSVKGIRECGKILANFEDNNCIGKSVGVGISLKNMRGPSFIFAVPLTSNPEVEKYSFEVDFKF